MRSSLDIAREFLGTEVTVTMDRPLGTKHPKHGFTYEVNYGCVAGVKAPDGEDIDAYYLGTPEPLREATGTCVAIVHRENDDDDKLVVVPAGMQFSDEEIMRAVYFQEQWFRSTVIRS